VEEFQVNPRIMNNRRQTVLMHFNIQLVPVHECFEVVTYLVKEQGVPIDATDRNGKTALQYLVERGKAISTTHDPVKINREFAQKMKEHFRALGSRTAI
jgi:histidinol phosphatase-like PHP family hydrolase